MRRALVLPALGVGLVLAESAAAAPDATLTVRPAVAPYGSVIRLVAAVSPAAAGHTVRVYVRRGESSSRVASGVTKADGTYRFATRARTPAVYFARISPEDEGETVTSPDVTVKMRPRLRARVIGQRVVGGALTLSGTLRPARSGTLSLRVAGQTRRVRVGAAGGFRISLPTSRAGRLRVALILAPADGYVRTRRTLVARLLRPSLALGSRGASVRALEERLRDLHYAVRRVDAYYGYDTYEAVLAFQKVQRMARTGRVGAALWSALARARVPQARVPSGDHIEVVKATQVLYEVRDGKVVRVVHVSTGATGNTPVGRWRVYRRHTGTNRLHMSYPMYFLRGFAIHGYPSVPPYPASHGCVRLPVWFAPGLYSRWPGLGVKIFVFP